jgi:hypothetical protein
MEEIPFEISGQLPEKIEFKEAEWAFQFDDDEPIVFAWTNPGEEEAGEVVITLKPNSQSTVLFASPDLKKRMRIFSREMSEETRQKLKNSK